MPVCGQDLPASPPVEEKRPGLLDGFLESLFGEAKPSSAPDFSSAPMAFEDDPQQPSEPKRIGVQDDFDEAIKLSQLEQRPLLVIAGADWCTWCRKLEKELRANRCRAYSHEMDRGQDRRGCHLPHWPKSSK